MEQKYIPPLPEHILDAAAAHVKEKYGIDIDKPLLTKLYWGVRWRREILAHANKKDPTLRVSTSFFAARDFMLNKFFPELSLAGQRSRKAYASALGVIGNQFSQQKDPALQLKRSELDRIKDHVTLDKDRRQYRLIF